MSSNFNNNQIIQKDLAKNKYLMIITLGIFTSLTILIFLLSLYKTSITLTGFLIIFSFIVVLLPIFLIRDIFHPYILLSLSTLLALINFIDKSVNGISLRYAIGFSAEFTNYAIQYSILIFIFWYLSFYMGFLKKESKFIAYTINMKFPRINSPSLISIGLMLFSLIGFLLTINEFGGLANMIGGMIDTTRTYAGLGYFRNIVSLGGIASLLMLYAGKRKASLLFLITTCVMLSFFGGRTAIFIGVIVPYLMVYNYKVKKIRVAILGTFGLAAFMFVLLWEQLRTINRIDFSSLPLNSILTSVAEKTRMADILPSLIGKILNGSIDYELGKPFLNILYAPIPRGIWEGKPEIIEETVLIGSLLIGSGNYYGLPAGPYGWAFLNFGWFGVIILGFLTGIVVKSFYKNVVIDSSESQSSFLKLIIYSLIIVSLFDVFSTSAQIQILWTVLVFIAIFFIDFILTSLFRKSVKKY